MTACSESFAEEGQQATSVLKRPLSLPVMALSGLASAVKSVMQAETFAGRQP